MLKALPRQSFPLPVVLNTRLRWATRAKSGWWAPTKTESLELDASTMINPAQFSWKSLVLLRSNKSGQEVLQPLFLMSISYMSGVEVHLVISILRIESKASKIIKLKIFRFQPGEPALFWRWKEMSTLGGPITMVSLGWMISRWGRNRKRLNFLIKGK